MRGKHPALLVSVALGALAGFGAVANAVGRRRTLDPDSRFRRHVQTARGPAGEIAAEATGPLGKEWLHVPAAAALGVYLGARGTPASRAVLPLAASILSELASRALDRTPPHRRPPPGHPSRHKPSFPSGHANETTAVALTSAYVLAREGPARPVPAFTAAVGLSLLSALGRLYLDRHWASDAVAGWLLGICIAAGCCALYEAAGGGDERSRSFRRTR